MAKRHHQPLCSPRIECLPHEYHSGWFLPDQRHRLLWRRCVLWETPRLYPDRKRCVLRRWWGLLWGTGQLRAVWKQVMEWWRRRGGDIESLQRLRKFRVILWRWFDWWNTEQLHPERKLCAERRRCPLRESKQLHLERKQGDTRRWSFRKYSGELHSLGQCGGRWLRDVSRIRLPYLFRQRVARHRQYPGRSAVRRYRFREFPLAGWFPVHRFRLASMVRRRGGFGWQSAVAGRKH